MSRICAAGDEQVNAFTSRPLDAEFPCLSLDATYCKVRVAGVGDSESEAFWTEFLRSLRDRGLFTFRVQLVICDAHRGLVTASGAVLHGSPGDAAGCISCATCSPKLAKATPA